MFSHECIDAMKNAGAVLSSTDDTAIVQHFGDLSAELAAATADAVVCPVHNLVRIRATGADRAKFLHNFCTNNVTALNPGRMCEAFFTDVKARVLAHGMILAAESCHEIWLFVNDIDPFLQHLNKYIVTEDVAFERLANCASFVVAGPKCSSVLAAAGLSNRLETGEGEIAGVSAMAMTWNDHPVVIVSTAQEDSLELWSALTVGGAIPAGECLLEHLRILEGYPLMGIDITSVNMAPEADRNTVAISYTKGCYLGQEPIARLDAMGHVNRKLFRARARRSTSQLPGDDLLPVNSASQVLREDFPVLLMASTRTTTPGETVQGQLADGTVVDLVISQ